MNSGKRKTGGAWACAASLAAMTTIGASLPAGAQDATAQHPAPSGPTPAPGFGPDLPAATPITDLLTRMDALETQVARLTAQNEELANRQHQIEARLAPAPTPAPAPITAPVIGAATTPSAPAIVGSASASNLAAMTGGASARLVEDHAAGPAQASAQRISAVKAVIKPATGDAGLDEYSYGFRLYTAKFYPEAAQQLKLYIDKYPKDAHISQARNLLGRAYLDDGKPHDAALWFLTNYKADPHGVRAPDSLLNLATAMHQLGDDTKACVALHEFAGTFASEAQGRLSQDYGKTRSSLTCN